MLVYAHRSFPLHVPAFLHSFTLRLSRLRSAPDRDQIVDLMIDFAEAESAVADAFLVEQDDERSELGPWRDGLDRVTTAFCASLAGDSETPAAELDLLDTADVDLRSLAARRSSAESALAAAAAALSAKRRGGVDRLARGVNRLLPQRYFDVIVQVLLLVTSVHLIVTSWPS